ncbi:MAG: hypothetical protein M3N97_13850 [Pseudomonadota bacterium]|nr:hypothetical protein [Pseudomonadota bacterium]
MKMNRMIPAVLIGVLASAAVFAQAPATEPTDPSAASSPHQRETVKQPGAEAPATADTSPNNAATPHQKHVMKKKHKKRTNTATPGT